MSKVAPKDIAGKVAGGVIGGLAGLGVAGGAKTRTCDVEKNVIRESGTTLCPTENFVFEGSVLRKDVKRKRVLPGDQSVPVRR